MAVFRARCGWNRNGGSRMANCGPWWRPPRSNWASISVPSTWSASSGRPARLPAALQQGGRAGHWVGALPEGPLLRHHPRRTSGMRRPGARHSSRRTGPHRTSAQLARHPGAADGRRLRMRGFRRGRIVPTHGARLGLTAPWSACRVRPGARNAFRGHRHRARTQRLLPASRRGQPPYRAWPARSSSNRHHVRRLRSRTQRSTWWWRSPKAIP